jgi:hypothetical protein
MEENVLDRFHFLLFCRTAPFYRSSPKYRVSMTLSFLTYLNGITALLILGFAYFNGFRFLFLYWDQRKKLMPLISLLAFSMGSFYLGLTVSFSSLVLTGSNIDGILFGFLAYIHSPISITIAIFLAYDIFKPHLRNRMVIIFIVIDLIWWISFFGFPNKMINVEPSEPGMLRDISLKSVILVIAGIYILSAVGLLGGNFYLLRRQLKDRDQLGHKKATYQAIGWVLFGIGALGDIFLVYYWVIIPRIIMFVAYYLIFQSFRPLKEE